MPEEIKAAQENPEETEKQPEPDPKTRPAGLIPISNLEMKRLIQLQACTRCGECLNWCPVYDQDQREDILPRKKAGDFLKIVNNQHGLLARVLKNESISPFWRKMLSSLCRYKEISEEEVITFTKNMYECSTCGQCQIVCPANIDTVNLWEKIRESMVMAGYGPLEPQKVLVKNVKSYDNPWQQPRAARIKWARKAKKDYLIDDTPPEIKKNKGKILLFFGCTAAFDSNTIQIAVSTVNILDRLGIDYGILGQEEKCCGSVLLRMGDPEFQRIATQNIDQFNSLGLDALVTSCAGCFKTISEDYPKVKGLNFEVLHTVQFLRRLVDQGRLEFKHPVEKTVTYHDPCHLGRASGVFDDPREIMAAIPGLILREMPRSREYSRCCGAGGGVKAGFPDIQNKMSQERIREAERTGATELVSACPFCFQGLQVGIGAANSPLVMRDITYLVEAAMMGQTSAEKAEKISKEKEAEKEARAAEREAARAERRAARAVVKSGEPGESGSEDGDGAGEAEPAQATADQGQETEGLSGAMDREAARAARSAEREAKKRARMEAREAARKEAGED